MSLMPEAGVRCVMCGIGLLCVTFWEWSMAVIGPGRSFVVWENPTCDMKFFLMNFRRLTDIHYR